MSPCFCHSAMALTRHSRGRGRWGLSACFLRLTGLAAWRCSGACAADRDPVMSEPSFYRSLTTADAKVDAEMAASMISGYRANNGLPAVTVDPALMKMAEEQARAMASARQARPQRLARVQRPAARRRATTPARRRRTSRPATTRWRRPSPAGATPRRTARTCCSTARPASASRPCRRRSPSSRCSGR